MRGPNAWKGGTVLTPGDGFRSGIGRRPCTNGEGGEGCGPETRRADHSGIGCRSPRSQGEHLELRTTACSKASLPPPAPWDTGTRRKKSLRLRGRRCLLFGWPGTFALRTRVRRSPCPMLLMPPSSTKSSTLQPFPLAKARAANAAGWHAPPLQLRDDRLRCRGFHGWEGVDVRVRGGRREPRKHGHERSGPREGSSPGNLTREPRSGQASNSTGTRGGTRTPRRGFHEEDGRPLLPLSMFPAHLRVDGKEP